MGKHEANSEMQRDLLSALEGLLSITKGAGLARADLEHTFGQRYAAKVSRAIAVAASARAFIK